jgi:hypothetical protein
LCLLFSLFLAVVFSLAVKQIVPSLNEKKNNLKYYCLENEKVPKEEPNGFPFKNLSDLIQHSSSDPSIIKHQPGFAGKKDE